MFGGKDDELATRWVQFGVFSPILRLHSGSNPFNDQGAVAFGRAAQAVMTSLPAAAPPAGAVPAHDEPPRRRARASRWCSRCTTSCPRRRRGLRRAEPVPVRHRAAGRADHVPGRPCARGWRPCARGCPPGTWVDVFTGLVYDGGRELLLHRDLVDHPRARPGRRDRPAGRRRGPRQRARQPRRARGAGGRRRGRRVHAGRGRRDRRRRRPDGRSPFDQAAGTFTVAPAQGALGSLPATRTWTVTFVASDGTPTGPTGSSVVHEDDRVSITVPDVPVGEAFTVSLGPDPQLRHQRRRRPPVPACSTARRSATT